MVLILNIRFVTRFHEFRIYESKNFSIEIKNVAKTVYFHTKRHFAAPLKENQTFFVKKKWIRRVRIRANMSRAS